MSDSKGSPAQIGFWKTTSLVAGNMIASGIFMLPVSLAVFGSVSLLGWIVSGAGAIVLAIVYARLGQLYPGATGGPYIYTKNGLGEFAGFLVAWSYWISIWSTNAAISLAFVSYLSVFFPVVAANPVNTTITALSAIWLLTWVNTRGLATAGSVQLVTTILKILPLVLVSVGGLFFLNPTHFTDFNLSGQSDIGAVTSTATLTLFAFLGLECATIPAGGVSNPEKTIPRATIFGTLIVTAIYFLGTVSVMGVIPAEELRHSTAPFSDAAARIWGEEARYLVAAGAVVSTFGALNGWILMQGQMPAAAASDRLLPGIFARNNRFQVPSLSLVGSSILISILLFMNTSSGLAQTFQFIILMSTMTVLVAYLLSMTSYMILASRQDWSTRKRTGNILLALIGFGYSFWALAGAGEDSVYYGLLSVVAGIPLYAWRKMNPN